MSQGISSGVGLTLSTGRHKRGNEVVLGAVDSSFQEIRPNRFIFITSKIIIGNYKGNIISEFRFQTSREGIIDLNQESGSVILRISAY